ncbi:MAG: dTMP kinase [Syntrophales bacterium]|jgi:dTMP kinase|nr:dTMP kinase [Syntrophales bacterium]NLN60440.1 dTMP kinase [Deltaproteobacteria bacterium]
MAHFITFEGGEGSGKTTQVRQAGEFLRQRGIPFLLTEEPGGTSLGLKIRELLLQRHAISISALAELLLFEASRCQHVETVIRPALRAGKVVLCDRYTDATIAYQGFGRSLCPDRIRFLNDLATDSLKPDWTFLLDVPAETGLARAIQRMNLEEHLPKEDRFEQETLAFHQRVRDGYRTLAQAEPKRFIVLDGTKPVDELHQEICSRIEVWAGEKPDVI